MISAITSQFARISLINRLSAVLTGVLSLPTLPRTHGARKEKTAMTNINPSFFTGKLIQKIAIRLAPLLAVMIALFIAGFFRLPFLAERVSAAQSNKVTKSTGATHTLVASYYSIKNGLKATLMISNQGPNQVPV